MKASPLIHGVWFVLAAGAFAVGHWTAGHSLMAVAGRPVVINSTTSPTGSMAAAMPGEKSAKAGTRGDDPAAWAQKYRDADGKIPADKMREAVQDALRDADPLKAMINFAQLIKELSPDNAPAAFKTLRETVSGFDTMRYMPMLTYAWGAIDGERALAAMKDAPGREAMFGSAATLSGWASTDPTAAKKWLEENGSPETNWMLNRGLVGGMARSDFDAATQYVMGLEEKDKYGLVDVLAEQKIKSGLTEATAWALGLTDDKMKGSALDRVAQQYIRQDTTQAAEWVKQYADEPFGKDAVSTVARDYAQKDPKAAVTWAATLPAGDSQSEAYGRVFREWARNDPTAASETLNTMPAGGSKDSAISSFSRSIARENPEDAITWAGSIADVKAREDAQVEVVQRWKISNADAANEWATANLSADAQQKASQPPQWDGRGGGPPGGPPGGVGGIGGGAILRLGLGGGRPPGR